MIKLIRRIKAKFKKRIRQNENERYQMELKALTDSVRRQLGHCGNNLKVFGEVDLSYPQKIKIGNECRLNHRNYLNARSGIILGDDVTISHGAMVISAGYDLDKWLETGKKEHFEDQPIYIGNHCWIGSGAIILPGVNITGEYVIIGAGAVVTKDIMESKVVVAGNPAKIVKRLGE